MYAHRGGQAIPGWNADPQNSLITSLKGVGGKDAELTLEMSGDQKTKGGRNCTSKRKLFLMGILVNDSETLVCKSWD